MGWRCEWGAVGWREEPVEREKRTMVEQRLKGGRTRKEKDGWKRKVERGGRRKR